MSEALWVEEYRPNKISDCVLPKALKRTFMEIAKTGKMTNMLLSGTAGTGKTTVAKALCHELDLEYIMINCSEDSGIDTLRNRIRQFASSISLMGSDNLKVVILDEFDYANATSFQPALRGFMEEFHDSCRFILTCNFKNKIIEPLHSRCTCIEFNTNKKTLAELSGGMHTRLSEMLTEKEVKFDPKVLAEIIIRYGPDWRRVINECQRHSLSGELSHAALSGNLNQGVAELMTFLKGKKFKDVRKWIATNQDASSASLYRTIFDVSHEYVEPNAIPQLVLILAEYQYKDSFAADKSLNTLACLICIMSDITFK